MLQCTILKVSTSKSNKTWLTLSVGDEFVYNGMVQSTKPADNYAVGQVISVPQHAIKPLD